MRNNNKLISPPFFSFSYHKLSTFQLSAFKIIFRPHRTIFVNFLFYFFVCLLFISLSLSFSLRILFYIDFFVQMIWCLNYLFVFLKKDHFFLEGKVKYYFDVVILLLFQAIVLVSTLPCSRMYFFTDNYRWWYIHCKNVHFRIVKQILRIIDRLQKCSSTMKLKIL